MICDEPVNCSTTTHGARVCRQDSDMHVVFQHINDNNQSCDQIMCRKEVEDQPATKSASEEGEKLKQHEP